jgi:transposase
MGEHQKVSVIGALCVRPDGQRVRLYLAFFPRDNIDGELVVRFLHELLEHLAGPVVLVWDRLGAHQHEDVLDFVDAHPRVRTFELPPYCPELNPVELLWRWLKWDQLANFAPGTLEELDTKAGAVCQEACSSQALLRSFIAQSELPLELDWAIGHSLCEDQ